MLTKRSQGGGETEDPTGAGQALTMGEAVASAFEQHGGVLSGLSREALARDLSEILQPLLSTCTNAEWIEAINARLDRLDGDTDEPGPRVVRFKANCVAEMTAKLRSGRARKAWFCTPAGLVYCARPGPSAKAQGQGDKLLHAQSCYSSSTRHTIGYSPHGSTLCPLARRTKMASASGSGRISMTGPYHASSLR